MGKDKSNYCGQPILGQLLSYIDRGIFKQSVIDSQSDRCYKQVKTWDHFVFMFYAIFTGSSSLREVIANFALMGDKLLHCGIFKIPKRSSISDSNANRGSTVFGMLYLRLFFYYREYLSDSFLNMPIGGEVDPAKVEIFDSTTITLFKEVFKGCGRLPENGQRKGGLKAFSKMTLSERVPNFICLKSASTSEKYFLSHLEMEKGTIAVFDKGFHKFSKYQEWSEQGVFYVTRPNDNARFEVVRQFDLGEAVYFGILSDMEVKMMYNDNGKTKYTHARMVAYIDPVKGKKLVFLTNLFDVSALTVCMLYKNRWEIECVFKQIKQNFELTYFLSDSPEGIKTQIWIALILNLIFSVIHKQIKEAISFTTMVSVAKKNAASYVAFIAFLKSYDQIGREILNSIEKVQLSIFDEIIGGGVSDAVHNTS